MGAPYPIEFVDEGDTIVLRLEEYDLRRMIDMESPERESGTIHSRILHRPLGRRLTGGGDQGDQLRAISTTNGAFPSAMKCEIVERFTPSEDASELAYEITVIDPATFSEPVVMDKTWVWLPDVQIAAV